MQRNCEEKMALIISSSTANQWPQNNQIDDQNLMSSTNMGIDKPTQEQIQQQQQLALKCPRCDSSNTKFCYYNNYSLSQPRHFCKACKRYWTRGGTLRNVPVGGGCRKNKRVKRAVGGLTSVMADSSSNNNLVSSAAMTTINPNSRPSQIDHGRINPLFFHGLHHSNVNPSSELNLSFNSSVDHDGNPLYEYDLQPQASSLGFTSSGQIVAGGDFLSKSLLSNYHHLPNFGSLSSSITDPPTMASILSPNLEQQKFSLSNGVIGDNRVGGSNFLGFSRYEDHMQMEEGDKSGISNREMNAEESQNRLNNQIQQTGTPDPNSLFWNGNGVGSWLDSTNSSVPSLI